MTTLSRRRTLIAAATLAALLAGLTSLAAVAADGVATLGSPAPEASDGVAATPGDAMDAMLEFAACMRENGVDMPDPRAGDGGMVVVIEGSADVDGAPALEEPFVLAEEACRGHLEAMTGESDPVRDAEVMEQLLAYAECMRGEGIDMPDPVLSGGSISIGMGPDDASVGDSGADPFSKEYVAAEEACRDTSPFGALGDVTSGTP